MQQYRKQLQQLSVHYFFAFFFFFFNFNWLLLQDLLHSLLIFLAKYFHIDILHMVAKWLQACAKEKMIDSAL